jgi:hypothetical protein
MRMLCSSRITTAVANFVTASGREMKEGRRSFYNH